MKTETILLIGLGVVAAIVVVKVMSPAQQTGPNWAGIGQGLSSVITSVGGLFKSKDESTNDDSELHY